MKDIRQERLATARSLPPPTRPSEIQNFKSFFSLSAILIVLYTLVHTPQNRKACNSKADVPIKYNSMLFKCSALKHDLFSAQNPLQEYNIIKAESIWNRYWAFWQLFTKELHQSQPNFWQQMPLSDKYWAQGDERLPEVFTLSERMLVCTFTGIFRSQIKLLKKEIKNKRR